MAVEPWHDDDALWSGIEKIIFHNSLIEPIAKLADKIVPILNLQPGAAILDLGCGVGRFLLPLARKGFKMTGVDRTRKFLSKCSESADAENLEVELINADMREFLRENSFDAIINMTTTFGYFEKPEDEIKTLGNVYRSLKKGGQFLIDLMGKEVISRIYQARDWVEREEYFMLEERKTSDDWSHLNMRWIIFSDNDREEYNLSIRLFSAFELGELLRRAGFSKLEYYGNFDQGPYDHKAMRMIIRALKE